MSKIKNNRLVIKIGFIKISIRKNYGFSEIPDKLLFFLGENRYFITRFFNTKSKYAYNIKNYKFNYKDIFNLAETSAVYPKNILTPEETVKKIVENKMSICRLGDGEEFSAMVGSNKKHSLLTEKLLKICKEGSNNKLLVCINNLNFDNPQRPLFYRRAFAYFFAKIITTKTILDFDFQKNTFYGDAYGFFFYFKENDSADEIMNKKLYISNIWKNRKVLFVINSHSEILTDNSIFKDVTEKYYIFGPDKNAFDNYDELMKNITQYSKDWLIYIEMGACATVLAHELSELGYQALDMGSFYSRLRKNNFSQG